MEQIWPQGSESYEFFERKDRKVGLTPQDLIAWERARICSAQRSTITSGIGSQWPYAWVAVVQSLSHVDSL